jgi:signal transduction histidine kinase
MGTGMDLCARRKDGVEFPIEAGLSHVRVEGDMLTLSSIVDVSKRKATEDLLERGVEERTRELERRRRVADSLRDVLDILNSDRPLQEILDYITTQASHLLGAEASAIYQLQDDEQPLEILASHGLSADEMARAADMAGGVVVETAYDPVGAYRAQLAVPLATRNDIFGGLMLYYREPRRFSSEEIELAVTFGEQAKLAIENARLRAQSAQVAVAAERNRIARDLHDSVTQTLFSASLIAEVLPRLWEKDHDESVRRLAELRLLTRGALAEMRTLLLELRPATLIEVDINELLRQLTEAAIGRARIPVELHVEGNAQLPPDVKIACYHIAQEALNNVTKHARAENASITLVREPNHVVLTVQDDGRGFERMTVTPEHLGLTIMHERAADIGATLSIDSATGAGTTISISWYAHE